MRKINYVFAGLLLLYASTVKAQIPNSSFENINVSGGVSNWSTNTLFAIAIDSNGHMDSLVIDGGALYGSVNDAHSGTRAIELRNAYNFTSNTAYRGSVNATTNDSEYSFFQTFIPVQSAPGAFSFYYKFAPLSNDSAIAELVVLDSSTVEIGHATIVLGNVVSTYTLAYAPVVYTSPGTAAFITVKFSTATATQTPTLGTRLIIDDVSLITTGVNDPAGTKNPSMVCYPTLVKDYMNIEFNNLIVSATGIDLYVINNWGQTVKSIHLTNTDKTQLQVSELAIGQYVLKAIAGKYQLTTSFIK